MKVLAIHAIAISLAVSVALPAAAQPAAELGEEAPDAAPQRIETRDEKLDRLYEELQAAETEAAAEPIVSQIQAMWASSGSDSMDLLLNRARKAMTEEKFEVARVHLSALTRLAPDFAEAWNASATLRFIQKDFAGSVAEIGHVLAIEPRHFSALTGLALVLEQIDENESAMKAWREVERLYPSFEKAQEAIKRLAPEVDGRQL